MRGNALRYAGWQVVDRTGPRVLAGLFIAGTFLALLHMAMRRDLPSPEQTVTILGQLHHQLVFLFLLLLMNGIVSQDRILGFYRFYLAKPVSPVWFYGQHAALSYIGTMVASAGFVIGGSLLLQPVWPWHLLRAATVVFALYGVAIFLCSTFVKHDWLLAGVVFIASAIARDRWPRNSGTAGEILNAVLPPVQLMKWNANPSFAQWLWIGAWGAGMFVIGLLVLRLRPLAED